MEPNTMKIQLDVYGKPFIVDICKTDYTKTKLSTYDYIKEEISACSYDDIMYTIAEPGIYKVTSNSDDYPDFNLIDPNAPINKGIKW